MNHAELKGHERVFLVRHGDVAVLRIDNPPVNATFPAVISGIGEVLRVDAVLQSPIEDAAIGFARELLARGSGPRRVSERSVRIDHLPTTSSPQRAPRRATNKLPIPRRQLS